jgi:hypothetical protein
VPTYPTGYTQAQAVATVLARVNETTTVAPAALVTQFLNNGLEQVTTELGTNVTTATVPLTAGYNPLAVPLPPDVQNIIKVFFSTSAPAGQNWYPGECQQVDWGQFVEFGGNLPNYNQGYLYAIAMDESGTLSLAFNAPQLGYLFLVYSQRVAQWDPANAASTVNVDSAYQELAILWACARVCESLENYTKAAYFNSLYYGPDGTGDTGGQLKMARETIRRRRMRKPSMVRDVSGGVVGPYPSWYTTWR